MIIHRYWDGEPRPEHEWTGRVLRSLHPGATVRTWRPETLPDHLKAIRTGVDKRHDANLIRYVLLHEQGGLWVDCDVIPLRNLMVGDEEPYTASLDGMREGGVLYFPQAGHPMMREVFVEGRRGDARDPSPLRSGGQVLTRVGLRHHDVRMEPRVIPFDAAGLPTAGASDPWAVHSWDTTFVNNRGTRRAPGFG